MPATLGPRNPGTHGRVPLIWLGETSTSALAATHGYYFRSGGRQPQEQVDSGRVSQMGGRERVFPSAGATSRARRCTVMLTVR